jgi:hypothetical protein
MLQSHPNQQDKQDRGVMRRMFVLEDGWFRALKPDEVRELTRVQLVTF